MATLLIQVDGEDKIRFEDFCSQVGMSVSTSINLFIKAVLREQKLPFDVKADPFYSETNLLELKRRIDDMRAGRNIAEHEIIEVDDEKDMA